MGLRAHTKHTKIHTLKKNPFDHIMLSQESNIFGSCHTIQELFSLSPGKNEKKINKNSLTPFMYTRQTTVKCSEMFYVCMYM